MAEHRVLSTRKAKERHGLIQLHVKSNLSDLKPRSKFQASRPVRAKSMTWLRKIRQKIP